jgi:hypothetical protein
MVQSVISNLRIPIVVPKRNKGSYEVLSDCNIKATLNSGFKDPVDFIQYIVPYIKNSCFVDTPLKLGTTIYTSENLETLQFSMNFLYHLDRSTSSFKISFYEMLCFYSVEISKDQTILEMGIKLPIRVKDIISLPGYLYFSVLQPSYHIYFEDILDFVQKHASIRFYPPIIAEDKESLKDLIDFGKKIPDYLNAFSNAKNFDRLGKSLKLRIDYSDVYDTYNASYETVVKEN